MTEDEAQAWIIHHYGTAAHAKLEQLVLLVVDESSRQNLIAASTMPNIWSRHVVDSAQLVKLASSNGGWLDVGTGGGFPGLVIAILRPGPMILVEPRRLRATFLQGCAEMLRLPDVTVEALKVEAVQTPAATISARAVASPEKLLRSAAHCATTETRWLLPRGQHGNEIGNLERHWHGEFHVEQSVTDPASTILIAEGVRPR